MLTASILTGRKTVMGKSFRFTSLVMRIWFLLVGMTRFGALIVLQNKLFISHVVLLRLVKLL